MLPGGAGALSLKSSYVSKTISKGNNINLFKVLIIVIKGQCLGLIMQNGKAYKAKELEMIMNCGKMVRPVFAVPYHVCPKLKKSLSLVWQFTILAGFCSETASLGSEGMNKKKFDMQIEALKSKVGLHWMHLKQLDIWALWRMNRMQITRHVISNFLPALCL